MTSNQTGIHLDIEWSELDDIVYLTNGGSSFIYTAFYQHQPVIVKTINPECSTEDKSLIEKELSILLQLKHPNIITLYGAGYTPTKQRFLILEKLEGGTLDQLFGHNMSIYGKKINKIKLLPNREVVRCARSIAHALSYCHGANENRQIILHRDLKPDNIGFTENGDIKIFDFGLACQIEDSEPNSEKVYDLSGGTGSLRYMAPEVANMQFYNDKVDVYSFSIILWELLSCKKPYAGLTVDAFYENVIYGSLRPPINKNWPSVLIEIMEKSWSEDSRVRPSMNDIKIALDLIWEKNYEDEAQFSAFRKKQVRRNSLSKSNKFEQMGGKRRFSRRMSSNY